MTETASHIALKKLGTDHYLQPLNGVDITPLHDGTQIEIPDIQFSIKSNDIIHLHANGLEILGRADDVINSGGIKIHPNIVEPLIDKLLKNNTIERLFYITKIQDIKLDEKVVLVIEGKPLPNLNILLKILKQNLPPHTAPKEIRFVPKIYRTSTGKVERRPIA